MTPSLVALIATPGLATEDPIEGSGPAPMRPSVLLQQMSGSRRQARTTVGPWPSDATARQQGDRQIPNHEEVERSA
jgi:hypothetical protein